MMFLWILVVLALVLWFSGAFGNRRNGSFLSAHADALEILKQRYARGEIDKAEFEIRRNDLTEKPTN
jgi:putative membrane protein